MLKSQKEFKWVLLEEAGVKPVYVVVSKICCTVSRWRRWWRRRAAWRQSNLEWPGDWKTTLHKEYLRLNKLKSPARLSPSSAVIRSPMTPAVAPATDVTRVPCKCIKSNGANCLAKKQQASASAASHPYKMYWWCAKARANVSVSLLLSTIFILFTLII